MVVILKQQLKSSLNVHEAIDNLSTLLDLEVDVRTPIGVYDENRFILKEDKLTTTNVVWLYPDNYKEIILHIKNTYLSLFEYLKGIYDSEFTDWSDIRTKKGLQAILVMAGEVVHNMDNYFALAENAEKIKGVADLPEYKKLQNFYVKKLSKKFEGGLEGDKQWQEQWGENEDGLILDIEKMGLKDFETIKKDKEYELFYIRNEDEKPFFSADLLRNIKLICDFDETSEMGFQEDPLLRIRFIFDKDLAVSSRQILNIAKEEIQKFYKKRESFQKKEVSALLNKSIMALMLASNQKNMVQNTFGKTCSEYFNDFHNFLIKALVCDEYQKLISNEKDKEDLLLLQLAHSLVKGFFTHPGGIKEEMIGYIHRLIRKGEEVKPKENITAESIWEHLLDNDDSIRKLLRLFPNGPMFKTLDVLREEEEEFIAFEPMLQGNIPSKLYSFDVGSKKLDVIRMPSPIRQEIISKAVIVDEYKEFLRTLNENNKQHLVINFQDRTSWKEFARCKALETLQKSAEFEKNITVITLPKSTDFYYQIEEYLQLNNVNDFFKCFEDQLFSEDDFGFYIPKQLDLKAFVLDAFKMIHKNFFSSKNVLSRKNRMDFVEIFYDLLILKAIDILKPDYISFVCKDSLDVGAVQSAEVFAFTKMITSSMTEEDKQLLLYLLYTPALLVRERSVDSQRLNRSISCLGFVDSCLREKDKKNKQDIAKLYTSDFLKNLKIN